MSRDYSDHERQGIAKEQFSVYEPSDSMTIINNKGFTRNQRALEQRIEKEEIEYRQERRKLEDDIDTLHRRKMKLDQEKRKG